MAALVRFYIVILILSLASGVFCQCSLNNLTIGTVRSGREIQGKPEWDVTAINTCVCPQREIQLSCPGFRSVIPVDPSILLKQSDSCLLIQGNTLFPQQSVQFSYAWDPPSLFLPLVSTVTC